MFLCRLLRLQFIFPAKSASSPRRMDLTRYKNNSNRAPGIASLMARAALQPGYLRQLTTEIVLPLRDWQYTVPLGRTHWRQ